MQQGYGGLVAVRRHKMLWMHSNDTLFFMIDDAGRLCRAVSMDSLEQETVSPSMVTVERCQVEEWEEGAWYYDNEYVYDHNKGTWEYEQVCKQAPGRYVTVIRKFVTPHLDSQTSARRNQFFKTNVKNLPNCQ